MKEISKQHTSSKEKNLPIRLANITLVNKKGERYLAKEIQVVGDGEYVKSSPMSLSRTMKEMLHYFAPGANKKGIMKKIRDNIPKWKIISVEFIKEKYFGETQW